MGEACEHSILNGRTGPEGLHGLRGNLMLFADGVKMLVLEGSKVEFVFLLQVVLCAIVEKRRDVFN